MSIFKVEDFGPFTLSVGCHDGPSEGMCVMEMVSFLAGEEWSDFPECACPVLNSYCRVVNDTAPDSIRDELQKFVPLLIGTKSKDHEQARAEIFVWAAVLEFAPHTLRAAGDHSTADVLAASMSLSDALDVARPFITLHNTRQSIHCLDDDGSSTSAAHYSAASLLDSGAWDLALPVLRRAIEAGPHGETLEPIHTERASILKAKMEAAQ